MMLYSMLLSSNRLTPEEGVLLMPFFKKNKSKKNESALKMLPELEEETKKTAPAIVRFKISRKTAISFQNREH